MPVNYFNPRPHAGGATQATKDADSTTDISIHVFHAGNNPCPRAKRRPFLCYFNPRFLAGATLSIEQQRGLDVIPIHATFAGGRLPGRDGSLLIRRISIHAPRAGGDRTFRWRSSSGGCFNPRPHARGDDMSFLDLPLPVAFQSTSPMRGRQEKRTSLVSTFVQSREYSQVLSCFRGIIQDISSENNSAAGEF